MKKSNFKPSLLGQKIEVRIPTPKNTAAVQLLCAKVSFFIKQGAYSRWSFDKWGNFWFRVKRNIRVVKMQLFGSWREWEGWRNLKSLLKLNFFQHRIRRNGVALPFQWILKFHSLPQDLKLDISKFSNPSLTTGESLFLNDIQTWPIFSDHDVIKWVRYIGKSGLYETRCWLVKMICLP